MRDLDTEDTHMILSMIDPEQFNEVVAKSCSLTEKLDPGIC